MSCLLLIVHSLFFAFLVPLLHLLLHTVHLLCNDTLLFSLLCRTDVLPNIFVDLATTIHFSIGPLEELLIGVHILKFFS